MYINIQHTLKKSTKTYLPGKHFSRKQFSVSKVSPAHSDPPLDGVGWVHVRVLDLVPVSHVALQSVYRPHSDHPPLTAVVQRLQNTCRHTPFNLYLLCKVKCEMHLKYLQYHSLDRRDPISHKSGHFPVLQRTKYLGHYIVNLNM